MKHTEKKYHVDSLDHIKSVLATVGAQQVETDTSQHYYGQHSGNDVTKLVVYKDRSEIHRLEEHEGKFSLKEKIAVKDKNDGLRWLREHGYSEVGVVEMKCTNYTYKNGIIGLYVLNNSVYSVILDFDDSEHKNTEQELGLANTTVISVPYDKYLKRLGEFEIVTI
jgi:adenylate cyclase class IV